jgi:hypothetical protein
MILMQGTYGTGYFHNLGDLGVDWTAAWNTAVDTATSIVKTTPKAVVDAATQNAASKLIPIAQKAIDDKAQSVIKKGNVAMFMLGGGALGAIVAGGSWQRRTVGGLIIAAAATAAGWQIGWLADK